MGCSDCGAVAELHDHRPCWVRDLPTGGRPVTLVWIKGVWRCAHPVCRRRTWTETSDQIARARLAGHGRGGRAGLPTAATPQRCAPPFPRRCG
ncbi:transposase family protein [Pseudonocardia sp. T1-2H]|uniref:transposase family protein n=1 Tax=Pseudonocardia sp. T1-2H TaxID=3128899 RepID=UPI0031010BBA